MSVVDASEARNCMEHQAKGVYCCQQCNAEQIEILQPQPITISTGTKSFSIGFGFPCFVIAEVGVNHNGSIEIAKRLIDTAAAIGVQAVKFQSFSADKLASFDAPKAGYQLDTTDPSESQYSMLKRLEFTAEQHYLIYEYCKQKDIIFLSSPFDEGSVDLLLELGVQALKIPSGELTNLPLLRYAASKKVPLIVSTGMSSLSEVRDAVQVIKSVGNENIILLHCVSNYPTSPIDANIKAIDTMAKKLNLLTGWSDHSTSHTCAIAAIARGYTHVIERHLTLDNAMEGPDHAASLNPIDFQGFYSLVRETEQILGDGTKRCMESEKPVRELVRKSLVAAVEIPAGSKIELHHILCKRPGTGMQPLEADSLVGKTTTKNIQAGTQLKPEFFK